MLFITSVPAHYRPHDQCFEGNGLIIGREAGKQLLEFMLPNGGLRRCWRRVVVEQENVARLEPVQDPPGQMADVFVAAVKDTATEGDGLQVKLFEHEFQPGVGDADWRAEKVGRYPKRGQGLLRGGDIAFEDGATA